MGYTTDFDGQFKVEPPLNPKQVAYLKKFSDTRRMERNRLIAMTMADPERNAVGLPIGEEAGYFVGGLGLAGQDRDASVVDNNSPPANQPGLWCKWQPTDDGAFIEWTQAEKFYNYVEWLEYLIEHFIKPWGCVVGGDVKWTGEEDDDRGVIRVANNIVTTKKAKYVIEE